MALSGIVGIHALTARRHASRNMDAARFACGHSYDAGLGGAALEEENDGGGSDANLDIQCVFTPFSAYMRQADTRAGISYSLTTCPPTLLSASYSLP
jgi:hypothetical protein